MPKKQPSPLLFAESEAPTPSPQTVQAETWRELMASLGGDFSNFSNFSVSVDFAPVITDNRGIYRGTTF